ncbi:hypothetical protein HBH56_042960 [Parastagonospora nodorum]|uniref:Uncharacterized protein n=2 Tax=Phaeosphaeria nodorum (strain SN15 / ATCC MYA-4574 / FGSC 10173) TaxID=321614 RepID=A0A7U2EXQ7_PHANO|nr:hypothetical protein SNOG_08064 [Parastagonospora nodorum SN15]KAH3917640.1 hypothetical protein HBH56_042960 [Parastagonospora nodorum]EAT84340.1 hypothetical protein SNOG_08064 [Parastagonospora nodorum SN15]KAH3933428.1 hypothetical protein HBH54_070710 [Parastagonospora nodorum]KAH4038600.1 hypothetical protein HBI09_053340 [Parastagonospora nodorum]KAH4139860.1 hypothetical protein HBH45_092960 [Parastagonospora nodorum]
MAPKDTSKISYSRADSGYLSDLISLARESDEAAAALLTSSPSRSSSSIEFTLRTFDDTDWNDVGRSSRQVTRQNRQCRAIAARIKTPTRFPIKPLAGTMARARKEVERMAARKSGGSFARSVYAQPVASQPMVCKMQDGSSQRGLWVDGKWFLPHQPLQMGSGFAKVPTGPKRITIISRGTAERDFRPKRIVLINRDGAAEREFRPKRIVLINCRPDQNSAVVEDKIEPVVERDDLQPKRITLINRCTVEERDFKPKRIVLINRRPDQANENTIKSGGTECATSGEKEKSQSVDGFGRTRAATKKIREQGLEFDTTNKIRRKRKSEDSVQGVRQGKMSKLDTSE